MPKFHLLITLIPAVAGCAAAQQIQPPAFEVASVREAADYRPPTPEDARAGRINPPRMRIEAEGVDITAMPMRLILSSAYGVPGIYIFGESWLDSVRWDIHAKLPAGAGKEQA